MQDTGVESLVNNVCKEMAVSSSRQLTDRRAKPNHPAQTLKCPRCDSLNTKFCYYNNYNLSQPRHFCKNCRRYWTKGGALRNVPVGGGCRKNKRSNKQKNSGDQHPHRNNLAGKSAPKPVSSADKCGGANSSSSSLVNNLQDGSDKSASIGFDSECNTTTTTNNNNNGTGSGSLSSGQQHQVFNTDLHQVQLLNSGNSLSSISYENPQFSIDPGVIGGSLSWSLADMQWKQQQSLTSLLTDGRSFDGSTITEPPPLLEDITSLGEAAISRFIKTTPALSWPSLLQDEDSGNNINKDNNNNSNNHHHAFDWQTNSSSNSEAFLEIQSDLGPWGGGNWPDLGNYGPGTSLP